jgi:hypothetical protein
MELAPSPFGGLPGFRRAIPSTPLDAYCYVVLLYVVGSIAANLTDRQRAIPEIARYGVQ